MVRKKNIMMFIVVLGLAVGVYKWIDYRQKWETGYCFSEKRYLTSRQLSDVPIVRLLKNLQLEYQTLSVSERERVIQYTSLDEFYSQNPNCCKMYAYTPENKIAWYKRLEKNRKSGLIANFGNQLIGNLYYQHDNSGPTKYRRFPVRLSFCGELRVSDRYSTGTPVSRLPGSLTVDEINEINKRTLRKENK